MNFIQCLSETMKAAVCQCIWIVNARTDPMSASDNVFLLSALLRRHEIWRIFSFEIQHFWVDVENWSFNYICNYPVILWNHLECLQWEILLSWYMFSGKVSTQENLKRNGLFHIPLNYSSNIRCIHQFDFIERFQN